MDWLMMAQQDFRASDMDILRWAPNQSRVLTFKFGETKPCVNKDLTTDTEWKDWFNEDHIPEVLDFKQSLAVILAGRAKDDASLANPALLRYLPWGKDTFEEIIKRMQVNASASRIVCTGKDALFNRTHIIRTKDGIPAIVYNCRTANTWAGDMALSATYIPSTHSTYAIVYGCSTEACSEITGRLMLAGDAICHPLLLPGIFAEIERKRQFALVKQGVTRRFQFVTNLLENDTYDWKSQGEKEEDTSTTDSVELWMAICYLSNGLKKWKQQILFMISHIDELTQRRSSNQTLQKTCTEPGCKPVQVTPAQRQPGDGFHKAMREAGAMIKERLTYIAIEYDEQVRDCEMVMEGMTMATELAHAKANMEIAVRTRRDSSQMKSIAVLTMVYLPATFVATFFSMSFFNWQPKEGEHVSPSFWIYASVSFILTSITLGVWYICAQKTKRGKETSGKRMRYFTHPEGELEPERKRQYEVFKKGREKGNRKLHTHYVRMMK